MNAAPVEPVPSWQLLLRNVGQAVTPQSAEATAAIMAAHLDHRAPPTVCVERDFSYGPHPLHRMDIFRPQGRAPAGVLVFVHGGGFVGGDKCERPPFYDNVGWWAVRQGWAGINVNYRLAPEHAWPAAIDDLGLALAVIRTRGREWSAALERLTLMGHSAGAAHVAGWLARHAAGDAAGVARAVLVSGLYDLETMQPSPGRCAYFGADPQALRDRSPAARLVRCGVPLTLAVAEGDPPELATQAERLQARWEGCMPAPEVLHLRGHNHFSSVLQLGAGPSALDSVLAPAKKA